MYRTSSASLRAGLLRNNNFISMRGEAVFSNIDLRGHFRGFARISRIAPSELEQQTNTDFVLNADGDVSVPQLLANDNPLDPVCTIRTVGYHYLAIYDGANVRLADGTVVGFGDLVAGGFTYSNPIIKTIDILVGGVRTVAHEPEPPLLIDVMPHDRGNFFVKLSYTSDLSRISNNPRTWKWHRTLSLRVMSPPESPAVNPVLPNIDETIFVEF